MDKLSSWMLRLSLVWLVAGFGFGAAMLNDRVVPGPWRVWVAPTHGHMLFVGWFLQFAIGVAYWLLPRRRAPTRPLGYREPVATAAVAALNAGLLLRIAAEPVERSGHEEVWTTVALLASALLQVAAVTVFAAQLWPRMGVRASSARPKQGD